MSGHSKWSTIKRQKEATDKRRGQLFSKLSRAITVAVRNAGSDPGVNLPLRLAVEKAREANMPKENIERAIERGKGGGAQALEEVVYEGYGPHGMAVLVEAATDNRNRTTQEIKNLFERGGGTLSGPGSVSYQFAKMGLILVGKGKGAEETMLELIDLGAPDLEETEDGIEVYVPAAELAAWRDKLQDAGFKVKQAELSYRPKSYVDIRDNAKARKVLAFLDSLDGQADVQRVFANLDIPTQLIK